MLRGVSVRVLSCARKTGDDQHPPFFDYAGRLENVETLLLDFFEFILHLDDDFLDLGMIGLGTCSIDFASHFLSDEAELLARECLILEGVDEILAVLAQADALLVDVKFLQVEYHLLLKSALVRFCLDFSKAAQNFFLYLNGSLCLILLYFKRIRHNLVNF